VHAIGRPQWRDGASWASPPRKTPPHAARRVIAELRDRCA
jgi:hypothetical protein